MSSTNEPEKQEPETPRPESATPKGHEVARQPLLTEVEGLHALVNEYKARDDQSYRLQRWNVRLTAVTAVIVFAYTTVAALQWSAARDALALARTNFVKDQRPYLWIKQMGEPILTVGQGAQWNLYFVNYGKSPAIHIRARAQIVFGEDREKMIAPTLFVPFPSDAKGSVAIVAPGGVDTYWFTAQSQEVLTAEDLSNITNAPIGLTVLTYLEYFDTGGNPYSTEVCRYKFKNGATGVCETHNEIH